MEMLVVVAIIVALAGIGGYFLLGQLSSSQRDAARAQTKVLTSACETYKIKNGDWPDSLQQLLQPDQFGNPQILKNEEALRTPWNSVYQYDKAGTNNRGLQPDIWAVDTSNQGQKVGNWPPPQPGQH